MVEEMKFSKGAPSSCPLPVVEKFGNQEDMFPLGQWRSCERHNLGRAAGDGEKNVVVPSSIRRSSSTSCNNRVYPGHQDAIGYYIPVHSR
ncbi:hypothetical protein VTO42DRAFT_7954 [Malbranchea cinnamomea]